MIYELVYKWDTIQFYIKLMCKNILLPLSKLKRWFPIHFLFVPKYRLIPFLFAPKYCFIPFLECVKCLKYTYLMNIK